MPCSMAATTASATDSALIGFGLSRSYGCPRAFAELGRHHARVHDRHSDPVGLHLDRERLGETHAGELRRRVHRLEGRADPAGDRADGHHVPSPPRNHARQDGSDGVHGAQHVHLHEALHLLVRRVDERSVRTDAGVDDEYVDGAQGRLDLCDGIDDGGPIGDIGGHRNPVGTDPGEDRPEVVRAPGDEAHTRTTGSHRLRHGGADASRCPRDRNHRAIELHSGQP